MTFIPPPKAPPDKSLPLYVLPVRPDVYKRQVNVRSIPSSLPRIPHGEDIPFGKMHPNIACHFCASIRMCGVDIQFLREFLIAYHPFEYIKPGKPLSQSVVKRNGVIYLGAPVSYTHLIHSSVLVGIIPEFRIAQATLQVRKKKTQRISVTPNMGTGPFARAFLLMYPFPSVKGSIF